MEPFDYQPRTRIVFGPGKIESLGELASELGARRALVVSDSGVIGAGHTARGLAALERAGIEAHLFDGVHENPTTDDVDQRESGHHNPGRSQHRPKDRGPPPRPRKQ